MVREGLRAGLTQSVLQEDPGPCPEATKAISPTTLAGQRGEEAGIWCFGKELFVSEWERRLPRQRLRLWETYTSRAVLASGAQQEPRALLKQQVSSMSRERG